MIRCSYINFSDVNVFEEPSAAILQREPAGDEIEKI